MTPLFVACGIENKDFSVKLAKILLEAGARVNIQVLSREIAFFVLPTVEPRVLAYIVSQLQSYSLLDSEIDVKGKAYEEIVGRDKVSLDLFWLRDESLEDSANLPDPHLLAQEIADDLRSALAQIEDVLGDLEQRAVAEDLDKSSRRGMTPPAGRGKPGRLHRGHGGRMPASSLVKAWRMSV